MKSETQTRTYKRSECAVFSKTKETFGGLSNMAAGFPLRVNGVRIRTSEALYQACRFPHRPEIQRQIIDDPSPMTAKMKSKPYRKDSRPDWDRVRVKIMRWCLRVKLAQNWNEFSRLLLATRERPIVEESRKDDFWGAKVVDTETLIGMNVLGRLLMELREEIKQGDRERLSRVEPLDIPDFQLYGEPISAIEVRPAKPEAVARPYKVSDSATGIYERQVRVNSAPPQVAQASLFDAERNPSANTGSGGGIVDTLKPYPKYRNSGVSWLGDIPAHWDIRRMKLLLREVDSRSVSGKEQLLRVSQYTGVTQRKSSDGASEPVTRAASLIGYKCVAVDDLVINIMLAWNGSMGVSRYDGIASPAYCVYRFRSVAHPWYYHELLRLPVYKGRIKAGSTGVVESRLRLYSDDLGRIEAIQPPPDEQAAIVRFLDYVNRRVERAIRAKRKVIALLNEQKQAIIHRAVTRGLDPNVRLKPSGILWLGDIPEHWTLKRFKFLATINSGQVDPRTPQFREMLLIAPNHIQSGSGKITHEETASDQGADSGKYLVKEGQIIYSKIRPNLRKVAIAPRDCLCSADMYPISLKVSEISRDYFVLLLLSLPFTRYAVDCSMRVAMPKVNREALADAWFWYPEPEEQDEILEYVRNESQPFDAATNRTEREISLIREYQIRLIADVVTGKMDVREAARNLPVEIVEAEATPEAEEIEEEGIEELAGAEDGNE